jgi:hypothetical protein
MEVGRVLFSLTSSATVLFQKAKGIKELFSRVLQSYRYMYI